MENVVTKPQAESAILIANIGELTAAVISRVAGNELSTAINGQSLTREAVHNLAISKLRDIVSADLKKK